MAKRKLQNILITGGSGFIGSNFIHYLFGLSATGESSFMDSNFTGRIVNVDCLTYAGNAESLADVEQRFGGTRYFFEKVDICDRPQIERILKQYDIDTIIHFAAESHGTYYCPIHQFLNSFYHTHYPVLPHIVNSFPECKENLRKQLGIPDSATVFGSYAGKGSFNIPFVQRTIIKTAENNNSIYFIFMNIYDFVSQLNHACFCI